MSAVQEIEAAIERLADLRDSATGAPWGADDESGVFEVYGSQSAGFGRFANYEDAELVVTLHRTIEAQLAILDEALRESNQWFTVDYEEVYDHAGPTNPSYLAALALARAILGGIA